MTGTACMGRRSVVIDERQELNVRTYNHNGEGVSEEALKALYEKVFELSTLCAALANVIDGNLLIAANGEELAFRISKAGKKSVEEMIPAN